MDINLKKTYAMILYGGFTDDRRNLPSLASGV